MALRQRLDDGAGLERLALPCDERAPSRARAFVRDALAGRSSLQVVETAQLLLSEMVTNAVLHAQTDLVVDVQCTGGRLRLAVSDGSALQPRPQAHAVDAEGGRGLDLIEALAQEWGVREVGGGKQVWCALLA